MEDKIKKLEDTVYGANGLLVKYAELETQLNYIRDEIKQLRSEVRQTRTLLLTVFIMTTVDFISLLVVLLR